MIKRRSKSDAPVIVPKLTHPADLQATAPAIFNGVFSKSLPVPSRMPQMELALAAASVPMRDRGSMGQRSVLPLQGNVQNPMQGMMQAFSQQIMQMMMSGGVGRSMQHAPLPGLKLFTQQPSQSPSPQLMDAVQQRSSSAHRVPELEPALPVAAEQVEEQDLRSIVPQPPVPAVGGKPVARKCSVDDAAAKLLAAMESKKQVKKRPAAAMAETTEGDGDGDIPDDAKPPFITIEHSRSQVLYRSGIRGSGQSKVFKFSSEATKAAAIRDAEAMVALEKRRRGL
jgi:hypothetical protein